MILFIKVDILCYVLSDLLNYVIVCVMIVLGDSVILNYV